MADSSTQLILDALSVAAAEPSGMALFGTRSRPGLFPSSAAARQAAARCRELDLLKTLRTETKGKTRHEICALSEQGLTFLLNQAGPKRVLENIARTLEPRMTVLDGLVDAVKQTQADLSALRTAAERALVEVGTPSNGALAALNHHGLDGWMTSLLDHLERRHRADAIEDCPLPELFRACRQTQTALTIGEFHDGLRRWYERERVYLHPWTGPLHEIPEPAYALLIGHEIAYYASLR